MGIVSKDTGASLRQRADAQNISNSLLLYGGITYFINSFDYPNFLISTGMKLFFPFHYGCVYTYAASPPMKSINFDILMIMPCSFSLGLSHAYVCIASENQTCLQRTDNK